ncbi:hypothetical protein IWQ49_003911 [Labrenzia sp. EL_126]|nr:hypothetical protein [Labrenzia sp. EL_126]
MEAIERFKTEATALIGLLNRVSTLDARFPMPEASQRIDKASRFANECSVLALENKQRANKLVNLDMVARVLTIAAIGAVGAFLTPVIAASAPIAALGMSSVPSAVLSNVLAQGLLLAGNAAANHATTGSGQLSTKNIGPVLINLAFAGGGSYFEVGKTLFAFGMWHATRVAVLEKVFLLSTPSGSFSKDLQRMSQAEVKSAIDKLPIKEVEKYLDDLRGKLAAQIIAEGELKCKKAWESIVNKKVLVEQKELIAAKVAKQSPNLSWLSELEYKAAGLYLGGAQTSATHDKNEYISNYAGFSLEKEIFLSLGAQLLGVKMFHQFSAEFMSKVTASDLKQS